MKYNVVPLVIGMNCLTVKDCIIFWALIFSSSPGDTV